MITFAKVKSSSVENLRKIIKVVQFGAKTAKQIAPYGIDSTPIENLTAIYAETNNDTEAVIIGYINKDYLTEPGEARIYSSGGSFVFCKNSGNLELNGNQYSAVRYQELNIELTNQINLLNTELTKIAAAGTPIGMIYVPTLLNLNLTKSESSTVRLK